MKILIDGLEQLEYHRESGRLIWCISKTSVKIGDVAGTYDSYGYRSVSLCGKVYKEHRLIYNMLKGDIPKGLEIDHINGIRDDNRIHNLRVVSHAENMLNYKTPKNNKSGVKGVSWKSSNNKWVAQKSVNGKRVHVGLFDNKEDAERELKRSKQDEVL